MMPERMLPPGTRSSTALGLLRGVAAGKLLLQRCAECAAVQYPPREACHRCLGADLPWCAVGDGAETLAITRVRVSTEEFFRARAPWRVGLVLADCGPCIVLHLAPGIEAGHRLRVEPRADPGGRPVLVGTSPDASGADAFPEFGVIRPGCHVLVTETDSVLGREIAENAATSGAARVFGGGSDSGRPPDLVLDTRLDPGTGQ